MSRRKDNKGRVLRTGESQRKDRIYQYRYTDALGNRKCIYASDLKTLREKRTELILKNHAMYRIVKTCGGMCKE